MDVEAGRNFTFKDGGKIDPNAKGTCVRIEVGQDTVNIKQKVKPFLKVYEANKLP